MAWKNFIPVVELIFYERDVKEFDDQDSIHNTLDKDEDEEIDITETDKLAKTRDYKDQRRYLRNNNGRLS